MIQELELNVATVILVIVVAVLFVLALRVATASWSGKRGCHGGDSGCCEHQRDEREKR